MKRTFFFEPEEELNEEEEKSRLLHQRENDPGKDLYRDYFLDNPAQASQDSSWVDGNYSKCLKNITRDWVYIYQDRKAHEVLVKMNENSDQDIEILDVGSMFYAALFFASVGRTVFLEPRLRDMGSERPMFFPQLNFGFLQGEAQKIPVPDSSFDVVTCLHAMEHFGLGRYGDTLDYYGDQKGLNEFNRVLKTRGGLILSVPASENGRIEFNGQRVYTPEMVDDMLDRAGFKILSKMYIVSLGLHVDDEGAILEPITTDRKVLQHVSDDQQAAYMTVSVKK